LETILLVDDDATVLKPVQKNIAMGVLLSC
jgi:hypothetical protein